MHGFFQGLKCRATLSRVSYWYRKDHQYFLVPKESSAKVVISFFSFEISKGSHRSLKFFPFLIVIKNWYYCKPRGTHQIRFKKRHKFPWPVSTTKGHLPMVWNLNPSGPDSKNNWSFGHTLPCRHIKSMSHWQEPYSIKKEGFYISGTIIGSET